MPVHFSVVIPAFNEAAGIRGTIDALVAGLPAFVADFEIAIGSREGVGARRVGEPGHRHLLGRVFNALVRALVLPGIDDSQCGFKLFTADAVRRVLPLATIEGWAFDVEVLAIARRMGLRVVEVPIEWHYREQSRVSVLRDPLRMIRDVVGIRARARAASLRAQNADPTRDPD